MLGGKKKCLVGYFNADENMHEDWPAILRHIFLIEGGAVSWYRKSQEVITLSTIKAEYVW